MIAETVMRLHGLVRKEMKQILRDPSAILIAFLRNCPGVPRQSAQVALQNIGCGHASALTHSEHAACVRALA